MSIDFNRKKEPSEKEIEKKLRERVENSGGWCVKFMPHLNNGFPDRFIFMPAGVFAMVELKKMKDGVPTELSRVQQWTHKKLRAMGFKIWVVYDIETMDELMQHLLK